MFKKATFILLAILLFAGIWPVIADAQGRMQEDILFYTNKFRKSKGKPALVLSSTISKEAEQHSRNMAKGKVTFGHTGFEDRVAHIRDKSGFVTAAAENVAYGQLDAQKVVDGWIKSAPHRKNILGDYNLIGIGTAKRKDGTLYFTQVFIKQK